MGNSVTVDDLVNEAAIDEGRISPKDRQPAIRSVLRAMGVGLSQAASALAEAARVARAEQSQTIAAETD